MKITLPAFVRRALEARREAERAERWQQATKRLRHGESLVPAWFDRAQRPDGSPLTKPSLAKRRELRRRVNRCARVARRANRD